MQFASITYLAFLAAAVVVYFLLPGPRSRTVWLLGASYAFYISLSTAWTAVLLVVTAVGYLTGLAIDRAGAGDPGGPLPRRSRTLMVTGIVLVVGILLAFKYASLASTALAEVWSFAGGARGGLLRLVLPVGISFWTFSTIAYLVEVAKGAFPAEKDPLRYALFVAFFPVVTAGPIHRPATLLPQLAEKHRFDYDGMRSGLLLMLWGFFKKLIVADPLGVVVGAVFKDPTVYGAKPIIMAGAVVAFAIQLYCDFSGYTDIVRGSARLFGVDLVPNFDRPYAARSVKEFWRRWHMSLMDWFKHYVYIPLGGSRVSRVRRYANVMTVFLISGIWHGAGLTFVVWGLLNGAYQLAGEMLEPLRARLASLLRLDAVPWLLDLLRVATTFALICIGWIFFRAESMSDALYVLTHLIGPDGTGSTRALVKGMGLSASQLIVTALAVVVVFGGEWLHERVDVPAWLYRQALPLRWAAYQAAILVVVVLGYYGAQYDAASFAYFRF